MRITAMTSLPLLTGALLVGGASLGCEEQPDPPAPPANETPSDYQQPQDLPQQDPSPQGEQEQPTFPEPEQESEDDSGNGGGLDF